MASRIAPAFGSREPQLTIVGGEGNYIETKEHGRLFDANSGYWYNTLGLAHPEIMRVKAEMSHFPSHLAYGYTHEAAENLAKKLCERSNMDRVLFSTSGSQACEFARKQAILYNAAQGWEEEQLEFAALNEAYHGSIGSMLKMIDPYRNPYVIDSPLKKSPEEIAFIVQDFEKKIEQAREDGKKLAGLFYEPLMGSNGAIPLPQEFIQPLAQLCRKYDVLLIADEVTTGFMRTGPFLANDPSFSPDITVLGKGITAGYYPLAATLVSKKITNSWNALEGCGIHPGLIHDSISSLSGTPEGCAIAERVLEILDDNGYEQQVVDMGQKAADRFEELKQLPLVEEVRGEGLFRGIEVAHSKVAKQIRTQLLRQSVNMIPEGRMVMFAPSFNVVEDEIDVFAWKLNKVLRSLEE